MTEENDRELIVMHFSVDNHAITCDDVDQYPRLNRLIRKYNNNFKNEKSRIEKQLSYASNDNSNISANLRQVLGTGLYYCDNDTLAQDIYDVIMVICLARRININLKPIFDDNLYRNFDTTKINYCVVFNLLELCVCVSELTVNKIYEICNVPQIKNYLESPPLVDFLQLLLGCTFKDYAEYLLNEATSVKIKNGGVILMQDRYKAYKEILEYCENNENENDNCLNILTLIKERFEWINCIEEINNPGKFLFDVKNMGEFSMNYFKLEKYALIGLNLIIESYNVPLSNNEMLMALKVICFDYFDNNRVKKIFINNFDLVIAELIRSKNKMFKKSNNIFKILESNPSLAIRGNYHGKYLLKRLIKLYKLYSFDLYKIEMNENFRCELNESLGISCGKLTKAAIK